MNKSQKGIRFIVNSSPIDGWIIDFEDGFSDDSFDKCSETKLMDDGSVYIYCKLGNWGVSGHDQNKVEHQARYYWTKYLIDGEYNSLLNN